MNEEQSQITQQKAKQNPELGTGQQFFQEGVGGKYYTDSVGWR